MIGMQIMNVKWINKILALILVIVMAIAVISCDNGGNETEPATDTQSETVTEGTADVETAGTDTDSADESETYTETEADTETETEGDTFPHESESVEETLVESETATEEETEYKGPEEPLCETCSFKTVKGLPVCRVCGYVAKCRGEHAYTSDDNGHWKPACEHCGKAEGKSQNHEIYEKIKDQGDRLAYIYLCSICDHVVFKQELSYDINVYVAPTDLAATYCYNYSAAYYFADGVGYTRFESLGAGGIVYAYEDTTCEDVSGRYLVMKMRMSGANSVNLVLQTVNAADSMRVTPCELPEDWGTVIIDLAKISNGKESGYIADGGGDYYMSLLHFYLDGNCVIPAGGYLDVSYITVVETIEDAFEFAGEDEILYVYENLLSNPFPQIHGSACEHVFTYTDESHHRDACAECGAEAIDEPHSVSEMIDGGTYTYRCVCGYDFGASKTVSEDVNVFLSPSYIAKLADNAAFWSGGVLMQEGDGEAFARIYGRSKNAAGKDITDDQKNFNIYSNGIAVTGQYLVIKYRIPDNDLRYFPDQTKSVTQTQIRMYLSTTRAGARDETDSLGLRVAEDGEWHVAIIDLSRAVGNNSGTSFTAAEDGSYTMKFLQLRLFYGGLSSENDYTDIAYVAVCDKLEEAKSLVVEDRYYCQNAKDIRATGTGSIVYKENDQCVDTHAIVESAEEAEGKVTYSYECSACGSKFASREVSSELVKYYSASNVSKPAMVYQATSKGLLADGDGSVYARYTGQNKPFNIFFVRTENGVTSPSGVDLKDSKYIVMRVRTNDASVDLALSMKTDNGASASVKIQKALAADEWTEVVIDINAIWGDAFCVDETGKNIVNTLYFYSGDVASTHYYDFSFISFCDSWDSVTELVDSDVVKIVSALSGNYSEVTTEDRECVGEHSYAERVTNESGKTVYSYVCGACGRAECTKDVSDDVELFISAGALGANYGMNHSMKIEDGIAYRSFTARGESGHIYVRDLAPLADSGKYLVVKMRISNSNALKLEAATGETLSGVNQQPIKISDEWQTAVVDLASFANYVTENKDGNVQLRFTVFGSANATVDIAYVAIVGDIPEAEELIDDESYLLYDIWKNAGTVTRISAEQ